MARRHIVARVSPHQQASISCQIQSLKFDDLTATGCRQWSISVSRVSVANSERTRSALYTRVLSKLLAASANDPFLVVRRTCLTGEVVLALKSVLVAF